MNSKEEYKELARFAPELADNFGTFENLYRGLARTLRHRFGRDARYITMDLETEDGFNGEPRTYLVYRAHPDIDTTLFSDLEYFLDGYRFGLYASLSHKTKNQQNNE